MMHQLRSNRMKKENTSITWEKVTKMSRLTNKMLKYERAAIIPNLFKNMIIIIIIKIKCRSGKRFGKWVK